MERERHMLPILNRNYSLFHPGKHGNTGSSKGRNGCTDENRMESAASKSFNREVSFKRFPLPPECVPVHCHIDKAQRVDAGIIDMGRHQHHASAGSKNTTTE